MGQNGSKMGQIALNHLFEHPKWCRNNFGKTILDLQVTLVTLP